MTSYLGRNWKKIGTLLTLSDLLLVTRKLQFMSSQPCTCQLSHPLCERAVKSTILQSYYCFLENADLVEFTQVVAALELDPHHVKPFAFRGPMCHKLLYMLSISLSHVDFRPLFVCYFAQSINQWV